jgi:hypothetical protein
MTPPRYQELRGGAIPTVALPNNAGTARIIAGEFNGTRGAAETVTTVILWDVRLRKGTQVRLPIADGFNSAVFVRSGSACVGETHSAKARQLALLESAGDGVNIAAEEDSEFLIVGGEPINEPVVAYGPFVMNTQDEIQRAIEDVRAGKLGRLD